MKQPKILRTLSFVLAALSVGLFAAAAALDARAENPSYPIDVYLTYAAADGTVLGTYTGRYQAGSEELFNISIPSPDYPGYVTQDPDDAAVTYDKLRFFFPPSHYIREGSASYTVVYVPAGTVRVRYLDTDGETLSPEAVLCGRTGDSYEQESPAVSGYVPSTQSVRGVYTPEEQIRTVTYAEILCSVTFECGEGTGGPADLRVRKDSTIIIPVTMPVRPGYTFSGWSRTEGGSAEWWGGEEVTVTGDLTLHALWLADRYAVRFYANGGSGAPGTQYKVQDEPLTLSSSKPVRSGWTFTGWSETRGGTVSYLPGMIYRGNRALTLYACWTRARTYTITYHPEGGTGGPTVQVKAAGQAAQIPFDVPVRAGWRFVRWASDTMFQTLRFQPGDLYTDDVSINLYAIWERATCLIFFDAWPGTDEPDPLYGYLGDTFTIPAEIPKRTGWRFRGWAYEDGGEPVLYPGDSFTPAGDMTLYAVWGREIRDLEIRDMVLDTDEVRPYGTLGLTLDLGNRDPDEGYAGVPLTLSADGEVILSTAVDFGPGGALRLVLDLDAGALPGVHTLSASLDPDRLFPDTDRSDNVRSVSYTILDVRDLSVRPAPMDGVRYAGEQTVVSYFIRNGGGSDLDPSDPVRATLTAYLVKDGTRTLLYETEKDGIVVPAGRENLVYFLLDLPAGQDGAEVYVFCSAGADDVREISPQDNVALTAVFLVSRTPRQAPETRYVSVPPADYEGRTTPPGSVISRASWTVWEYEGGAFELKTYGARLSFFYTVVGPDPDCPTAYKSGSSWVERSGYAMTLSGSWKVVRYDIHTPLPEDGALTEAQAGYILYPEFGWSAREDLSDDLYLDGPDYSFPGGLHFIPLYVTDGPYRPWVSLCGFWTPAGELTPGMPLTGIRVEGSLYDDYYTGAPRP